jgi:hypothetical protein
LIDGFTDEETQDEAMRCIRSLIDKIIVRPNAAGDDLDVDLHGALATFCCSQLKMSPLFSAKMSRILPRNALKRELGIAPEISELTQHLGCQK